MDLNLNSEFLLYMFHMLFGAFHYTSRILWRPVTLIYVTYYVIDYVLSWQDLALNLQKKFLNNYFEQSYFSIWIPEKTYRTTEIHFCKPPLELFGPLIIGHFE